MGKKFVIISSCYNKGIYLHEWADSIIKQSYRPLSIVIANDCSTDNSKEVLNKLMSDFYKNNIEIEVLNNKRRLYCGSSYHNLMKYISGDYFGIVDSDDVLVGDAVEYIVNLYEKFPDIYWIYTQFQVCDRNLRPLHKGISRVPHAGMSFLDMGKLRKHAYSHWRTFSNKVINPQTLFKKGLRCAVDKYMGYKLEEIGTGLFVDKICYLYREGVKRSVAGVEKTKKTWKDITIEVENYRKKNNIKPFPIFTYEEKNG